MTTLTPRTRGVLALAAVLTAAPTAAVAAGPGTWTAQVVPSTAAVSQPRFLFDSGQVVGVDLAATQFTGQPWRWSAATGRRDLSLGEASGRKQWWLILVCCIVPSNYRLSHP